MRITFAAIAISLFVRVSDNLAQADTIAITNATVYQTPTKKLESATVVIKDGFIIDVGAGVKAPAGAVVIDGKGKVVTAGLIEVGSTLGLVEVDLEASANDGRFATTPTDIHAAFKVTDAYDPRSVAIPIARSGGVTSAIVQPSGGLVAGMASWFALIDQATPAPPLLVNAGMSVTLGAGAVAGGSRGGAIEKLRELLLDAEMYQKNRTGFERNQSRALSATRADLEALLPVLAGKVPLLVRADAESDIRAAIALTAQRKILMTLSGGQEAWRVAPELAAAKIAVVLDPTANLPEELAVADVRNDNLAVLNAAGVRIVISPLGATMNARNLRQMAGIGVGYGLPWDKALAAITSVPAELFSPAARRGTVEVGKAADLVLWTGDPLEIATRVSVVMVQGVVQSLESHQSKLLQRYRKL
jgi:imidazolonepropionase-like amidohydrolase